MDSSQRKKIIKRSAKRQFKQSPLLNLYILLLAGLIIMLQLLGWSTILMLIKPLNGLLMSIYVISKLTSSRIVYVLVKAVYILNLLKQIVAIAFDQDEELRKVLYFLIIGFQQVFTFILLREKFCKTQISILEHFVIYVSAIAAVIIQGKMVFEVYPYIRINRSEYYFFICFFIIVPLIFSLLRYQNTTSRSFWFCLVACILIWFSQNIFCYQNIIGETTIFGNMLISGCSHLGYFLLMHGCVLHFMFRKALIDN